jgi:hypothetical protein
VSGATRRAIPELIDAAQARHGGHTACIRASAILGTAYGLGSSVLSSRRPNSCTIVGAHPCATRCGTGVCP